MSEIGEITLSELEKQLSPKELAVWKKQKAQLAKEGMPENIELIHKQLAKDGRGGGSVQEMAAKERFLQERLEEERLKEQFYDTDIEMFNGLPPCLKVKELNNRDGVTDDGLGNKKKI